jgi:hypothetical protein
MVNRFKAAIGTKNDLLLFNSVWSIIDPVLRVSKSSESFGLNHNLTVVDTFTLTENISSSEIVSITNTTNLQVIQQVH